MTFKQIYVVFAALGLQDSKNIKFPECTCLRALPWPTAPSFQCLPDPGLTFRGSLRTAVVLASAVMVKFPGMAMGSGSTVRLLITAGSFPASQLSQEKLPSWESQGHIAARKEKSWQKVRRINRAVTDHVPMDEVPAGSELHLQLHICKPRITLVLPIL